MNKTFSHFNFPVNAYGPKMVRHTFAVRLSKCV